MKAVIIFGSTGMLGQCCTKILKLEQDKLQVIPVMRNDCDLTRLTYNSLRTFLSALKSKYYLHDSKVIVINAAEIIRQRKAELHQFMAVNAIFPQLLDRYAAENSWKVIHISTDSVFSGKRKIDQITRDKGNLEKDPIEWSTGDVYAVSKGLGENTCNSMIIRSSVIGHETSTKLSLLEWFLSQKNAVNGYTNHYWNGITSLQLAIVLAKIIDKDLYWIGVRHIYSPTIISKYELLQTIAKVYNVSVEIIPIECESVVDRSLVSSFVDDTSFADLLTIPSIEIQLESLKQTIHK